MTEEKKDLINKLIDQRIFGAPYNPIDMVAYGEGLSRMYDEIHQGFLSKKIECMEEEINRLKEFTGLDQL